MPGDSATERAVDDDLAERHAGAEARLQEELTAAQRTATGARQSHLGAVRARCPGRRRRRPRPDPVGHPCPRGAHMAPRSRTPLVAGRSILGVFDAGAPAGADPGPGRRTAQGGRGQPAAAPGAAHRTGRAGDGADQARERGTSGHCGNRRGFERGHGPPLAPHGVARAVAADAPCGHHVHGGRLRDHRTSCGCRRPARCYRRGAGGRG